MKNLHQPIILITLVLVSMSCSMESETSADQFATVENIRKITTRFYSHQDDTQEKDDRVVAIATINPDGSLEGVVQHMTYPYNLKDPYDRDFWMQPDIANLGHIMDGLKLGKAEENLLYGNDWPVKYAREAPIQKQFGRKNAEGWEVGVSMKMNGSWPTMIRAEERKVQVEGKEKSFSIAHVQQFEFAGNKVTRYGNGMILPVEFYPEEIRKQMEKEGVKVTQNSKEVPANSSFVDFSYEGENLVSASGKKITYKFFYDEEGRLARSEFHNNGKLYNSRYYFYNRNGLKEKTEVFNVHGEPEYTIEYEYEFFES